MVTILDLIAKNDRDIELFRECVKTLDGKPGMGAAAGTFQHNIKAAEQSNAILRVAR